MQNHKKYWVHEKPTRCRVHTPNADGGAIVCFCEGPDRKINAHGICFLLNRHMKETQTQEANDEPAAQ